MRIIVLIAVIIFRYRVIQRSPSEFHNKLNQRKNVRRPIMYNIIFQQAFSTDIATVSPISVKPTRLISTRTTKYYAAVPKITSTTPPITISEASSTESDPTSVTSVTEATKASTTEDERTSVITKAPPTESEPTSMMTTETEPFFTKAPPTESERTSVPRTKAPITEGTTETEPNSLGPTSRAKIR